MLGDVLFIHVVVYVHPEGSIYADSEIFDNIVCISIELLEHFNLYIICLTGDFNARTVSVDDFVLMDEIVSKANPLVPDLVKDFCYCQTIRHSKI